MKRFARSLPQSLIPLLCLFASGCSLLGLGEEPFPWFEAGSEFVYDYHSVRDTLLGPDGERVWHVEEAATFRIFPMMIRQN